MSCGRRLRIAALLLSAVLASGCATGAYSMRTLPDETPAADNAAAIRAAQALRAELAAAAERAAAGEPEGLGAPLTASEVPSVLTYDPWERMNRFTYRFNARFDEALFLPAADNYRKLPAPVRSGVHNFCANLTDIVSTLNYLAQLRLRAGARNLARLVVNTTLGIGGLFDVATPMHLPAARTGFGNTLARWGVKPGPFFVMPILGPYALRDGFGFLADYGTNYAINPANLFRGTAGWILTPLAAIDVRSRTSFRYYSTGSPFEYDMVRFLFVRATLIEDDALRLWQRSAVPDPDLPAGK